MRPFVSPNLGKWLLERIGFVLRSEYSNCRFIKETLLVVLRDLSLGYICFVVVYAMNSFDNE